MRLPADPFDGGFGKARSSRSEAAMNVLMKEAGSDFGQQSNQP
jgi:hypothetical protein